MQIDSVIFYTSDLGNAIDFYHDVLGLTLDYRDNTYASFSARGTARLGIKQRSSPTELPGHQSVILSAGNDIRKIYETLLQKGVLIFEEYTEENWGIYFSIRDPDGNKIEFIRRK